MQRSTFELGLTELQANANKCQKAASMRRSVSKIINDMLMKYKGSKQRERKNKN